MRIGVGWIFQPAACVPDFCINHSGNVAQNFFNAPEAASSEHSNFSLFFISRCRVNCSVLFRHLLVSSLWRFSAGLFSNDVGGVPGRPVSVALASTFLVL